MGPPQGDSQRTSELGDSAPAIAFSGPANVATVAGHGSGKQDWQGVLQRGSPLAIGPVKQVLRGAGLIVPA